MTSSVSAAPAAPSAPTSKLKRVVAASMAGTVVEWYEFFLYATAASLVFGTYFFPATGSPLDGIIAAFVTYAVGFIARPLGGIVFGQIGDRFGRKPTLQATIIIVGAATFLMGCLPGFQSIGYWAPALLVALRFLQGFAVGGEWGGAVLLVAEQSPDRSRSFWSSWPQAAVPVGNLLATLVLLVSSWVMTSDAFLEWGWRIAFWLSAVIVLVGFYIRRHVEEAPIFLEAKAQVEAEKATSYGVVEVLRRYPKGLLQAMGLRFAENIVYYIVVSFTIVYLKTVHEYDTSQLLLALLIAHVVHFAIIPQLGRLADRWGRKPVYLTGAILSATWAFFAFPLFDTLNPVLIVLAVTVGLCFHAFMYAPQPAVMAELFPTRMRYSGVSLGSQVTAILAGSLAPILAIQWLRDFGSWLPIAIYIVIACVVTAVAVLSLRETKGISLQSIDDADAARTAAA
ncbi:MHS family MFS transporter [Microbacterium sp. KSW4-16]|uniref:MHS family MFS transporter n=1 Tax=Microbacterium aurugineum TaxID=2851642 RepID=A0ABY4J5S4_9MICO|nr:MULTISPECIES: MFS transporter [Microbacterium]MCK8467760.1 MHS family MFS transporter [Microbacterium aurugineum]QEA27877.1 MHS family MFS transporter [Microbacterium sp. CBA3102]TCJ28502.1 MFS transporter [Microbacterium sp. PI-1]TFB16455.1 MFS transporter [Microbacterium sp. 3H14]UPL19346.1 MHS family MFS transporter [Microbacterium aurugineum]